MAHQYVDGWANPTKPLMGQHFVPLPRARYRRSATGIPTAREAVTESDSSAHREAAGTDRNLTSTSPGPMAAAQRLMLKYNVESITEAGAYSFRHLGEPTGRVSEALRTSR
jgi:hypothetical protein